MSLQVPAGVPSATDEELLRAVQAGDTRPLGTLVLRWELPLFRFVYRLAPCYEDACDICQETFLRILKGADRFKPGARFSTWMYQIALNLCRDRARKARRWQARIAAGAELPERPAGVLAPDASRSDPADSAVRREQSAAVMRALAEIPAEQREVVVLKEFQGLTFREISQVVGCPESTVKSRMYYGLSSVRSALKRQGLLGP
jgi:RNA polymerase sigma-70 factor (ECF subfamily)